VGNAMNLSTGILVDSRPVEYYFGYSGISESNEGRVLLQMKIEIKDWLTNKSGVQYNYF